MFTEKTHVARWIIEQPLNDIPVPQQSSTNRYFGLKPSGFWFEVNGDWRRWCSTEMPQWIRNRWLYTVDDSTCRLLKIKTGEQLNWFHQNYCNLSQTWEYRCPNWHRLFVKGFDGIEISPYQWKQRLEMMWYYGWDCASGVIWNASKVRIALIGQIVEVNGKFEIQNKNDSLGKDNQWK